MDSPRPEKSLTAAQENAVAARGNVLVMAGAGTGKTHTLVERCLSCLCDDHATLDEILVVTFTEAAAAEMRLRLRRALEKKSRANPDDARFQEQLALFDTAHIGTLHSFCLKLVREHFYELGLDPQLALLDEGEAYLLAEETLDEQLQAHYQGAGEFSLAVQELIQIYGAGRDEKIRALILRLYHYAQTRPDADGWLADQHQMYSAPEPIRWREWLAGAIQNWRAEWLPVLENLRAQNNKAAECLEILAQSVAPEVFHRISIADNDWPRGTKKTRAEFAGFFDDAAFLGSLMIAGDDDPLAEDWRWVSGHMAVLIRLAQEFTASFSARKQADGTLDFHDLEQFALKLLWDFAADKPTAIARRWREKLRFIFVDEYQDINAAQDKIISALARDGAAANRFLVGDVKQSIYRFRLADPKIFRDYAQSWRDKPGRVIPLAENFRSREALLDFVNSVFTTLMRPEIGGVAYDDDAKLKFGAPETRGELSVARTDGKRVELLLRLKALRSDKRETESDEMADLGEVDKEARLLAARLRELKESGHKIWDEAKKSFRAVEWRDMAVLLRALSGKAEIYAKQFERAGVPLAVARAGFFDSREILDLLSLLKLLDNPLQDVPCIAVLRSPLVGLSLEELAQVRLCGGGHFWFALNQARAAGSKVEAQARGRIKTFLDRFAGWRKLARQVSLSQCLETVLVETHYADWLRTQERGAQRHANVAQFLNLAQRFDQFQRQGLFRFLHFIAAQQAADIEPETAATEENAVRLMSIHKSKGLEFPVVALPDLAKRFQEQDSKADIIFDEIFGLCAKVKPPQSGGRYPSLPHWLAQKHQQRELRGEELRLLYVALTRARDTLILTASVTEKKWNELLATPPTGPEILKANNYDAWLALWLGGQVETPHLDWKIVDDAAEIAESEPKKPEATASSRLEMPGEETVRHLRDVLSWHYPAKMATERPAKSSVTALRRAADEDDGEAKPFFPALHRARAKLSAADMGTAHHSFLQHVALEQCGDIAGLRAEAERLVAGGILSAEEKAALDLPAILAFWNSDTGGKIRSRLAGVKRELPFTARFSPAELEQLAGVKSGPGLEDEFVVVQGVADLVVLLPEEIWLVDFKTDAMRPADVPDKIKNYAPQLKLYSAALEKIYRRPVTQRWLHFLAVRRTEKI